MPFLKNTVLHLNVRHNYETRNHNNFLLPIIPRILAIRYNSNYQGLSAYNNIPASVKAANSLNLFK